MHLPTASFRLCAVVLATVVFSACPPRPDARPRTDAGMADGDAGAADRDGGRTDAGNPADSGSMGLDAGPVDVREAGFIEGGLVDSGRADGGHATDDDGGDVAVDAGDVADGHEDDSGAPDAGAASPDPTPEPTPDPTPEPTPEPPPVGPSRLTDITLASGIRSTYWDRTLEDFYCQIVLQMGGGVALGDVDGDGVAEIFLTRFQMPAQLYKRNGAGYVDVAAQFGLAISTSGNGATFVDVDDDGDLDLFVGSLGRENDRLYIQRSDGRFVDETAARIPAPVLGGACGNVFSVIAVDVDKDGDLDLHTSQWNTVTNASASRSRLLINNGNGVFENRTLAAGIDLSRSFAYTTLFTDLNNDTWPDALVSGDFGTSRVFLHQGTSPATFVEAISPQVQLTDENGMGGALGDYDRDGDLDWFVTAIYDPLDPCGGRGDSWECSGNRLYRNDVNLGSGVFFSDVTDAARVREGGWGWGAVFADLDNDGDEDLLHVNGYTANDEPGNLSEQFFLQPGRAFLNNGGTFVDATASLGFHDRGQGRGVVAFDYDDDGDLDVLVTNNKEGTRFFRNDISPKGAWLKVRLQTVRSAPGGVGAIVEVTREVGDVPMRRVIGTNATFLSSPEPVAHFGLGAEAPLVYQVRVVWPRSSSSTLLFGVAPNQTLTILEPTF